MKNAIKEMDRERKRRIKLTSKNSDWRAQELMKLHPTDEKSLSLEIREKGLDRDVLKNFNFRSMCIKSGHIAPHPLPFQLPQTQHSLNSSLSSSVSQQA